MFTRKFSEPCVFFNPPSIHLASKRPQQQKTKFVLEKIYCTIKRIIYMNVNT